MKRICSQFFIRRALMLVGGAVIGAVSAVTGRAANQPAISPAAAAGAVAPAMPSMIPGSSGPDADVAWAALMQLLSPTTSVPVLTRKDVEPRDLTPAGRFHVASVAAKEFYKKYPNDFRAGAARKYEAIAELQGVQHGATRRRDDAVALGQTFRGDQKNNADDRLEVAIAMETLTLPEKLNGRTLHESGSVHEAMIDRLYAEFGDTDRVYGLYMALLHATDAGTAQHVAANVLTKKHPPAWAKSQAQDVVDRAALKGKPAQVSVHARGGRSLGVSTDTTKPTVLYFWAPASRLPDLAALQAIKASVSIDANWTYVGLGAANEAEGDVASLAAFPGEYSYEPDAFKSATAKSLKVVETPWAVVFDHGGHVSGSGPASELPALLQAAAQ